MVACVIATARSGGNRLTQMKFSLEFTQLESDRAKIGSNFGLPLQYSVTDSHLLPMKSSFIVSSFLCLSLHPSSPSHASELSESWIPGFQPCGGTHMSFL